MKTFLRSFFAQWIIFFFCISYSNADERFSTSEEELVEKTAKTFCEGTVSLYLMALDTYFQNQGNDIARKKISERIDQDTQNNVFYTQYIEKEDFIDNILSTTYPHAKKIMQQYPNNPKMYQAALYMTEKLTYPLSCQLDIKKVLREAMQE